MPYCTLDDISGLIVGFKITDTSNITIDQVNNDIIPAVDRYIDDRLGKYYVTPITGANAVLTINRIARWLAAADVMERVYIGQAPSDSPQSTTWRKFAEDDLSRIQDGTIILTDAVPTDDTPESFSHQISDILSQPSYCKPPKFSMGMKF